MSCLDMWVAAFDRLSEAIENWQPCCDGVSDPISGTEDVVTVDDTDIPADNTDVSQETHPTEFPTFEDFRDHQCGLAHNIAGSTDSLIDRIEGVATTAQNIVVFATLIVLAYANIIGMAIAAILAGGYAMVTMSEIFGAASAFSELRDLIHGGDPFGADEAKTALAARSADIVDAVYCANDATEASANLRAILDAELSGPLLVLAKLMWSAPMLRLAFEFSGTVTPRSDCTCEEPTVLDVFQDFGTDEGGCPSPWTCSRGQSGSGALFNNSAVEILEYTLPTPINVSIGQAYRVTATLRNAGTTGRTWSLGFVPIESTVSMEQPYPTYVEQVIDGTFTASGTVTSLKFNSPNNDNGVVDKVRIQVFEA